MSATYCSICGSAMYAGDICPRCSVSVSTTGTTQAGTITLTADEGKALKKALADYRGYVEAARFRDGTDSMCDESDRILSAVADIKLGEDMVVGAKLSPTMQE